MFDFQILLKKQTLEAISLNDENAEFQINNLKDNGFKPKLTVQATDKQQALSIFMANNKSKRGIFSRINKWLYILFHLVMFFSWMSFTQTAGEHITQNAGNTAANAGTMIGGAIGTSMLFVIWGLFGFFGAFIVFMTRAKPWDR